MQLSVRLRPPNFRGRHLIVIDLVCGAAAIVLALGLRADLAFEQLSMLAYVPAALLPLLARPLVNLRFGLYRREWRHASIPELTQIVRATLAGSLVAVGMFVISAVVGMGGTVGFPRSFWIIEGVLSLLFLGGVRFAIRAVAEAAPMTTASDAPGSATLLYGAGRAGSMVARSARDPRAGVRPVGFLDDDPALHGQYVAGLAVLGGLSDLEQTAEKTGAKLLLITMPDASGRSVRRIVNEAARLGLEVRTVPQFYELFDGSVDAYRIRRIKVEDLLRRPAVQAHAPGVTALVEDRVVFITGAGGSIGSELARQVYAQRPQRIVLLDRAEGPLYGIQRDLEMMAKRGLGGGDIRTHIANVATRAVMQRLILEHRPDIIFHAAAYKHVPMMEQHPSDAVHVNVGGTLSVLDAAEELNVSRFVLVSTDKAVRPSSVMGASKRIAEGLVAEAAYRTNRTYLSVRFGNVLGSSGSVVPIFQHQLEDGQPLTITHPEMTRYFMTIPEAVWLILDAAAIGAPGNLLVLDMGEPVRIIDLAQDLIRLAGRDPASVPIEFTGLRPGEKLHEELFYAAERVTPTASDKVMLAAPRAVPRELRLLAQELISLATGDRDDDLRTALFALTDLLEEAATEGAPQPRSLRRVAEASLVPPN
jgi:FlaA1/EpsC-like NDP-sugar epimerase